MSTLNAYLFFNGNCAEAFAFYAEVLGGQLGDIHRFGDSPMAKDMPAAQHLQVMHTSIKIGDSVLMGSDGRQGDSGMTGFSMSLNYKDISQAKQIFDRLAEGGTVRMAFGPTFFAAGFGMLIDRFGTPWMINVDP